MARKTQVWCGGCCALVTRSLLRCARQRREGSKDLRSHGPCLLCVVARSLRWQQGGPRVPPGCLWGWPRGRPDNRTANLRISRPPVANSSLPPRPLVALSQKPSQQRAGTVHVSASQRPSQRGLSWFGRFRPCGMQRPAAFFVSVLAEQLARHSTQEIKSKLGTSCCAVCFCLEVKSAGYKKGGRPECGLLLCGGRQAGSSQRQCLPD